MTRIIKVGLSETDHPAIKEAAKIMKAGGLVVFPTETVYGIGTIATDVKAVESVFAAKQRPSDTPLPVQIASADMLTDVTRDLPAAANVLAKKFWPGPLTMVLPKHPSISDVVTAGSDTVGIRIPDHPVMLSILQNLGAPAVATSANISGCPSPVTAQEAAEQIGDKVELIIESGPCSIGHASTVIGFDQSGIKILRQGSITLEQLQQALQE